MKFADIPELEELKHALVDAVVKNHLAHAQLFYGKDGGAALPIALAYAQYILCINKTTEDSCGTCPNCVRVAKGIHPDVHYFFPKITIKEKEYDKQLPIILQAFRDFMAQKPFGLLSNFVADAGFQDKTILISKDDSRRLIRNVSMKSVEGASKIILIWLPEYFNPAAANAILKALEEPPAETVYLLVTNAYENLLPTITSRVLLFSVPPISAEGIQDYVIEQGQSESDSRNFALLGQGSIGAAMEVSQSTEAHVHEEFQQWMRDCLGNRFGALMDRAETFGKSGRLAQRTFLEFSISVLRDSLISVEDSLLLRSGPEAQFVQKFNSFTSLDGKQRMYQELNKALNYLERNANPKMTHFHLSTEFSQLLRV